MIKWYFSKWEAFFAKQQSQFDLSDENINRATTKDYWVFYKLINSPVFWLLMLTLVILAAPFILLFSVLEGVFALLVIAAGVAFLISLYMILTGQASFELVILCIGSGILFLSYTIGFPLIRRTTRFKRFKKRYL